MRRARETGRHVKVRNLRFNKQNAFVIMYVSFILFPRRKTTRNEKQEVVGLDQRRRRRKVATVLPHVLDT